MSNHEGHADVVGYNDPPVWFQACNNPTTSGANPEQLSLQRKKPYSQ